MPFHDQDSEDLARDCATFPAYTDYLYGPDMRMQTYEAQQSALPSTPLLPIRYTNSRPSLNQYYSGEDGTKNVASTDLRYPASGLGVNLTPPQFVSPVSTAESNMRMLLDGSGKRTYGAVSTQLGTLVPSCKQQAQTLATPRAAFSFTQRVPTLSLMRSSSATDVDEDRTSLVHNKNQIFPSEPISSVQQAALPRAVPSTQGSALFGMTMFRDENGKQAYTIPALGHGNGARVPVLRPGDVLQNPEFAFVPHSLRQQLNEEITKLWYTANQLGRGAESMSRIHSLSRRIHQKRQESEQNQRQEEDRMRSLERTHKQDTQRDDDIQMPPESSTLPMFDQGFQPAQNSLSQEYPTLTTFESSLQRSPLAQQPDQQPTAHHNSISPVLRQNIHRHLPVAWEYLQLSRAEDALMRHEGQQHLAALQADMPEEGLSYMRQVLSRMMQLAAQGYNPLSAIGEDM